MAKKKNFDTPADFDVPGENTIADAPAADIQPQAHPLRYVGPGYHLGIKMHGSYSLIRPASFSDEQRQEFLSRHPDRSKWWTTD